MNSQQDSNHHINPVSLLALEYQRWKLLYQAQSGLLQHFIETQALTLAEGLMQPATQIRFNLPDRIITKAGDSKSGVLQVPPEAREQTAGGLLDRLNKTTLHVILREKLTELEASPNPAIALSAGLMQYAIAVQLVYVLLPDGKTVHYQALDGEEIPSIPEVDASQLTSAITEATDAIVEEPGRSSKKSQRGELQVPYVPFARRFYLPQWVAFDDEDQIVVGSLNEAEANLTSMQHFLRLLHLAASIAPYIITDEQYQRKRYGILGQLVNQGRAMARFETQHIVNTIRQRATANDLNRGLSLSLPYFDDQILDLKTYDFQVIPAGRIMFVPAFVVRSSRLEQVKVAQDTRLSRSTRNHLLSELETLENAFTSSEN